MKKASSNWRVNFKQKGTVSHWIAIIRVNYSKVHYSRNGCHRCSLQLDRIITLANSSLLIYFKSDGVLTDSMLLIIFSACRKFTEPCTPHMRMLERKWPALIKSNEFTKWLMHHYVVYFLLFVCLTDVTLLLEAQKLIILLHKNKKRECDFLFLGGKCLFVFLL